MLNNRNDNDLDCRMTSMFVRDSLIRYTSLVKVGIHLVRKRFHYVV